MTSLRFVTYLMSTTDLVFLSKILQKFLSQKINKYLGLHFWFCEGKQWSNLISNVPKFKCIAFKLTDVFVGDSDKKYSLGTLLSNLHNFCAYKGQVYIYYLHIMNPNIFEKNHLLYQVDLQNLLLSNYQSSK